MKTATFSEFRNSAKKYFDEVEQGETVQIFRHVKPVAYLVPIKTHERSRWKTSRPLNIPGVSLSKALLQEREEG